MSSRDAEACSTSSELTQLQGLLAKQHDDYLEMLQEPIDNAVSATVESELYYHDPEPVRIHVDFERRPDTVEVIIADEGCGMDRETIRDIVFETGNRNESDGILNNIGAGLKASIAWCEQSLKENQGPSFINNPFHLLSRTEEESPIQRVDGPIGGGIEVYDSEDETLWGEGTDSLEHPEHGTRVHLTVARDDFDDDVSGKSEHMSMKASYIAEVLGVRFRRLLDAHDENAITITYRDIEEDGDVEEEGRIEVPSIDPVYEDEPEAEIGGMADYDSFEEFSEALEELDIEDDARYDWTARTIIDSQNVKYHVSYECGIMDLPSTGEAVDADERDFLVTTPNSDDFRWRYKNNMRQAGVDVYGNGRVLDIAAWPYDNERHNRFNRFVGTLRIVPADPGEHEIPTENDKTGIEKQSSLWREIDKEWLDQNEFNPFERDSQSEGSDEESDDNGGGDGGSSDDGGDDGGSDDDGGDDSGTDDDGGDDDGDDDSGTDDDGGDDSGTDDDGGDDDGDDDDDGITIRADASLSDIVDSIERVRSEDDTITSEFDADGAEVDILHRHDSQARLVKIADGRAVPDDVYDAMMYQDHYKRLEEDYARTVLIGDGISEEAEDDLDTITEREDEHGDIYAIEYVSAADDAEGVPWIDE